MHGRNSSEAGLDCGKHPECYHAGTQAGVDAAKFISGILACTTRGYPASSRSAPPESRSTQEDILQLFNKSANINLL
jgi:hypothetical protein